MLAFATGRDLFHRGGFVLRTLGKYTLVEKLTVGGMAEVWIAREDGLAGLSRLVIVKVVLPSLSEDSIFRTMFLDEARIVAQLNHSNIVQIYDLACEGDDYFIAMELIQGENLATILDACAHQRRAIPQAISVRIMSDALKGLYHAHMRQTPDGRPLGIIHRDLSPQNIMVTYEGDVKVVDFGIAKAADRLGKTNVGVIKGKYRYMSPEQVSAKKLDHRSDLFSAGLVLYELCTGARAFDADSQPALLRLVYECKFPLPKDVNPAISPELEAVILKAMQDRPENRFADANEFRLALDHVAANSLRATNDDVASFVRDVCREHRARMQKRLEAAYAATKPAPVSKPALAAIDAKKPKSDEWEGPTSRDGMLPPQIESDDSWAAPTEARPPWNEPTATNAAVELEAAPRSPKQQPIEAAADDETWNQPRAAFDRTDPTPAVDPSSTDARLEAQLREPSQENEAFEAEPITEASDWPIPRAQAPVAATIGRESVKMLAPDPSEPKPRPVEQAKRSQAIIKPSLAAPPLPNNAVVTNHPANAPRPELLATWREQKVVWDDGSITAPPANAERVDVARTRKLADRIPKGRTPLPEIEAAAASVDDAELPETNWRSHVVTGAGLVVFGAGVYAHMVAGLTILVVPALLLAGVLWFLAWKLR